MIGRLLQSLWMLVLYLCLGTVVATACAAGYLWSAGYLSSEKLAEIDAVMRDFTSPAVKAAVKARQELPIPSLDQLALARAKAQRDLELREQALRHRAEQIQYERMKLGEESARYLEMKQVFEKELAELHDTTVEESIEQARSVLENLKPKQAKEQLLRMIGAGEMDAAVRMLAAMPLPKRVKVAGEFKSEEDAQKLAEILRRIREGVPEINVIDETQQRLKPGGSS